MTGRAHCTTPNHTMSEVTFWSTFYRMARTNSRGDQANLFYVVWPEEEAVTTLSAVGALDPTLCSPQVHRSATTHRHQQTLQSHDRREQVGSFASPLTSPVVMRTSPAVQTSPKDPGRTISTNGQVERDNIIDTSNSSQTGSPKVPEATSQSMPATSSAQPQYGRGGGEGVAVSKEHDHDTGSSRKPPHMQHYNPNRCLECEVKDAEIWTLRKRIQVIKEVVELPNQKLSAIQQSSNSVLFSPMVMAPVVSEVVIPSTYTTPPTTSVKVHMPGIHQENSLNANTPPHVSSDNSSNSASIAYAQSELCPAADHRVELISGSGVYVTLPRLEEARREAKNGTQLARKLMDAFWDHETLARSSLSNKKYQQLDPNVINAIEASCLSFDSTTCSKDLHGCITDKCCRARKRRGAPFKLSPHNGLQHQQQNSVAPKGLHNGTAVIWQHL